jgi:hypothetical protein
MFDVRLIASLLAVALMVTSPAIAQGTARSSGEVQATDSAPLEAEAISRWMNSLATLRPWGEANEDRFERDLFKVEQPRMNPMNPLSKEALQKMRSPFSGAVSAARSVGVDDEVAGLLAPHGFTLDEWGDTGDRIIRAFVALQIQGGPDMRAQLDTTIVQMEENTRLSVAQKNQLISSLMQTLDIYNMMSDAPAADIEAVRPLAGLLEQTLSD